jgi:hypothetical protein
VEWLLLLVVFLLLPVAALTSAAAVATMSLRRANRVVPGRGATGPPIWWLWSPGYAALLHRRLRSACQLVTAIAGPLGRPGSRRWVRPSRNRPASDGIAELARGVLQEAVLLDRQVVAANYLARGMPRAQALSSLEHQVRSVEDAARRVNELAARRARLGSAPPYGDLDLDQRITAMEAALGELARRPPA